MAKISYENLRHDRTNLSDLDSKATGFLYKDTFWTPTQKQIHRLTVDNGVLKYIILFTRGMDIENMWYKNKQIGWERDDSFLQHPEDVNLEEPAEHISGETIEGLGWLKGFYAMDAMVGPSHFGGPCVDKLLREKLTLHDRNSYSICDVPNVTITVKEGGIVVDGVVPIKYEGSLRFVRRTSIKTGYGRNSLIRTDETKNTSGTSQIFDDGHHIQFGGALLWDGSQYVVSANLRARDDEAERWLETALRIPAPTNKYFPERCYFLEPNPIKGHIDGVVLSGTADDVTVQMIRTADSSLAGFVAHKISDYKCVTLWQQYGGWQFDPKQNGPIWYTAAIEAANSFPDNRNDKREKLRILEPNERRAETVEIGAVDGIKVGSLEKAIMSVNLK